MNYLEAKTVLLRTTPHPQVTFKVVAVEVVALLAAAGILVRLFA